MTQHDARARRCQHLIKRRLASSDSSFFCNWVVCLLRLRLINNDTGEETVARSTNRDVPTVPDKRTLLHDSTSTLKQTQLALRINSRNYLIATLGLPSLLSVLLPPKLRRWRSDIWYLKKKWLWDKGTGDPCRQYGLTNSLVAPSCMLRRKRVSIMTLLLLKLAGTTSTRDWYFSWPRPLLTILRMKMLVCRDHIYVVNALNISRN